MKVFLMEGDSCVGSLCDRDKEVQQCSGNTGCASSSFPVCTSRKKNKLGYSLELLLGIKYAHLESKSGRMSLDLCQFLYSLLPSR